MPKEVKIVLPAHKIDMGGIPLKQALPTAKVEQVDPFLLVHHAKLKYRKYGNALHQGIGPHPHRGFSPVTFVIDGEIHHRDSRGNNQIAKKGEVQWMHAGSGIVHSERPSQALIDRQEANVIIQLWVNSPASKKMNQPSYQYIPENEIPRFNSPNNNIITKVISGVYNDIAGKIKSESDLLILWSKATGKDKKKITIPQNYNCMLYTVKGNIKVEGFGLVEKEHLVVFENNTDVEQIKVSTTEQAEFIIMAGLPINEKIVQQGPFVMNSETEILEAMRDYQMGKMGILIEE